MAKNEFADAFEKALKKLKEDASVKKEREGEETLKRTLREMYGAYRDRKSPKPDYAERYPSPETPVLDARDYRSDYDLRAAAAAAAREKYAAKRAGAAETRSEISDAAEAKQETAYRDYRGAFRAAGERVSAERQRAAATVAARGVRNSTVAEAIEFAADRTGTALRSDADAAYRNAVADTREKIAAAEEIYRAAIRNFDIAAASETEKTLFRLKKERDAALRTSGKTFETAVKEAERATAARENRIAADEAARDAAFRKTLEERAEKNDGTANPDTNGAANPDTNGAAKPNGGAANPDKDAANPDTNGAAKPSGGAANPDDGAIPYEGGEASEMENRYRVAESYYASLPKDSAAKLLAASEDELKFLLGAYYPKLKAFITRK